MKMHFYGTLFWHIIKQRTKGFNTRCTKGNPYVLFCHNFDIFYHRRLDNYRIQEEEMHRNVTYRYIYTETVYQYVGILL